MDGDSTRNRFSRSPFPQIADYGFLSDCECNALVAPSGNVEWLCLPRLDAPSVFGAVLDRHAGGFRLAPDGVNVPVARRYLPGTMVLETSWTTSTGWMIVRDALLMGPWHHISDMSESNRRVPTDYDADHVLLRTIRCVNGEVQVRLDCDPMFDYGQRSASWEYTEHGYHEGVATAEGIDLRLRLTTDLRLGFEGGRASARTLLREGDLRFVALSWTEHEPPRTYDQAYERQVWTAHHWQHWLARGNFPDHRWRVYLERSALTLKGLTFGPTGALVAAPTTSLPETPGGSATSTTATAGSATRPSRCGACSPSASTGRRTTTSLHRRLAERDPGCRSSTAWVARPTIEEHVLDHLGGYGGAQPVRIGNAAHEQRQNDVWGAVLDSVYIHTTSTDRLDDRIWSMLRRQVEAALSTGVSRTAACGRSAAIRSTSRRPR